MSRTEHFLPFSYLILLTDWRTYTT